MEIPDPSIFKISCCKNYLNRPLSGISVEHQYYVLGPCPSRGALVSGVITLPWCPTLSQNTMKFDV